MSKPSPKRPMTPDEIEAAKLLQGVSFPPATFDKRFAATVRSLITRPPPGGPCNCQPCYVTHELHSLELEPAKIVHAATCPVSAPPWVPMIGEKMVPQLWRLVSRYRRQIRHPDPGRRLQLLRMAELLQATDFRARQKGMKILAQRARDREKYAKAMQPPQTTPATPQATNA